MAIDYNELYQSQLRNLKKHLDSLPKEGVRGRVQHFFNNQGPARWYLGGVVVNFVLSSVLWAIFKSPDAGMNSFVVVTAFSQMVGGLILMGGWDCFLRCDVETQEDKENVSDALMKLLKENPKLAKHFASYLEYSEQNKIKHFWSSMLCIYLSGLSAAKNLQLDDIPDHREEIQRLVHQACQEDISNCALPVQKSHPQEHSVGHPSWVFWKAPKHSVLIEETPNHPKGERWNM